MRRVISFNPSFRDGRRFITISIPTNQQPLKPSRRPARGGQNLSERYKRLENAVRGREALTRSLEDLSNEAVQGRTIPTVSSIAIPIFHGFQVPQKPKPPADDGMLFHSVSKISLTETLRMLHVRLCRLRI